MFRNFGQRLIPRPSSQLGHGRSSACDHARLPSKLRGRIISRQFEPIRLVALQSDVALSVIVGPVRSRSHGTELLIQSNAIFCPRFVRSLMVGQIGGSSAALGIKDHRHRHREVVPRKYLSIRSCPLPELTPAMWIPLDPVQPRFRQRKIKIYFRTNNLLA